MTTAYQRAQQIGLRLRPCLTPEKTNIDPTRQVIKGPLGSTKLTDYLQQTNLFEGAEIIEGSCNQIAIVSMSLFASATYQEITLKNQVGQVISGSDPVPGWFLVAIREAGNGAFGAKSPGPGIPGWDLPSLPKAPKSPMSISNAWDCYNDD